jgi:LPS export ABC transporter protein LptC/lipopolysaccharide transport protein LptA
MKHVRIVSAGKAAALGVFITIAAALVVYLVFRNKHAQQESGRPKLQGKVVAVFSNTHYSHEVNGQVRFNITAGTDRTYEDGTHELEQVRLESYGAAGTRHDVLTCDRAKVSDPSDLAKLDAEFISNVVVQTSEELTVKTSYLHYDQVTNKVDTKEVVEFSGRNYEGRATGLILEGSSERASLLKDVDLTIKPESESARDLKPPDGSAASSREETPEERAARKARKRALKQQRRREAEALAKVPTPSASPEEPITGKKKRKETGESGSGEVPQTLASSSGPGSRKTDPGKPAVKRPIRIQSESAILDKKEHQITFDGNATVTQDADLMRANKMVCYADSTNHLERIEARGSSYLKQADKAEISSPDMDFFFGETHQLSRAVALGGASTRSLGIDPVREASADTIEAIFVESDKASLVDTINTQGNAIMKIHAPAPTAKIVNPAARELKADNVSIQFFSDGKNIKHAEAHGKAVLTVIPVRQDRRADKKTLQAPNMEASFYESANRIKTFSATEGVRVEFEATVAEAHPPRVTTSTSARADFLEDSQDIDRVSQEGNFKYNEGDRNGIAERAIYDDQKEILNLRGGRPMVWDAKARTQADEIDYDRQRDETHARGDVRTTYYSRETTNDSTPFKNTKSPVFITAERADTQNGAGVAVYTINARGWQDDNFIKANRIELYQDDKRMVATGNVESALYQAKQETSPGTKEVVPGFATADKMTYSDTERKIHYEGNVKARQGTDRIEATSVDVYLMQETNEVDHLNADGNVVLTQPGRRGVGDKLAYTSEDGRAILTGRSARVDDVEKGSTMGSQLTFYSRDDRISVENQQGTGRVRSTHRLNKSKQN